SAASPTRRRCCTASKPPASSARAVATSWAASPPSTPLGGSESTRMLSARAQTPSATPSKPSPLAGEGRVGGRHRPSSLTLPREGGGDYNSPQISPRFASREGGSV